jgi:hypothetical protein
MRGACDSRYTLPGKGKELRLTPVVEVSCAADDPRYPIETGRQHDVRRREARIAGPGP